MKLKSLALATSLLVASPAFSADWTPVLKEMQNSCKISAIEPIVDKTQPVPKSLKDDVISHKVGDKSVIALKNATAFGYPLTKIERYYTGHSYGVKLYFKSVDFNKILPKFSFKVGNQTYQAGVKKAFVWYEHYEKGVVIAPKEVPYPKRNKEGWYDWEQYQKNVGEMTSVMFVGTPTGWLTMANEMYGGYDLITDSKKKTLACNTFPE